MHVGPKPMSIGFESNWVPKQILKYTVMDLSGEQSRSGTVTHDLVNSGPKRGPDLNSDPTRSCTKLVSL